jgi:serine acetyltransferase
MDPPIGKAQEQLFAPGTTSGAKYSALVVGRPGFAALLKHEFVVTLAQARAGAIGLALRKTLYPWLLGSCGRNVIFGQNVVLRHPHKIHIGDNVVIDYNCLLDATGGYESRAASSSVGIRSCPARTATSSSAMARTSASIAKCFRPAA